MENGEFINKLRQQHHQQQQPAAVSQQHQQEAADLDPNFDRKLDLITAGARPFIKQHLLTRITGENCQIIVDYFC
jgi:hypothetical protein